MNKIDELRNRYYDVIRLLYKKEEILEELPSIEYENFLPLIKGIIELLEKDLSKLKENIKSDEELKEYIEEEIDVTLFKIDACHKLIQKYQETKELEENFKETEGKNLIFAKTVYGNICLENDLKFIPEEYYKYIENGLIELQEGSKEDNTVKGRQLTNNSKLANIHELKFFKIRLMYKILAPNTLYIMMARMKKSDNDCNDRREVINRANQTKKEYEELKEIIKDPIKKEELILEHKEYIEKIIGNINKNKR